MGLADALAVAVAVAGPVAVAVAGRTVAGKPRTTALRRPIAVARASWKPRTPVTVALSKTVLRRVESFEF